MPKYIKKLYTYAYMSLSVCLYTRTHYFISEDLNSLNDKSLDEETPKRRESRNSVASGPLSPSKEREINNSRVPPPRRISSLQNK